ncbi:MAG: FAD-dependent oxidoreductase, partial [Firmicutes bacterium]|nr:FAD-dependent oxidoreductase [Bacillota bacterium]
MVKAEKRYDVAVVGLGVMGLFAAFWAVQNHMRVIAFDPYTVPHALGASHGQTRAIESTYYEQDDRYLPLVRRTWRLWDKTAAILQWDPLQSVGGLAIWMRHDPAVERAMRWSEQLDVPVELWSAGRLRERLGDFLIPADMVGLYEAQAGIVLVEPLLTRLAEYIVQHGAIIVKQAVTDFVDDGWSVHLST